MPSSRGIAEGIFITIIAVNVFVYHRKVGDVTVELKGGHGEFGQAGKVLGPSQRLADRTVGGQVEAVGACQGLSADTSRQ